MSSTSIGPLLVGAGAVLVIAGLLAWAGGLDWFGRLPGDIRVNRDGFRFYFPIVSCIVISVALTVLLAVFRRLR